MLSTPSTSDSWVGWTLAAIMPTPVGSSTSFPIRAKSGLDHRLEMRERPGTNNVTPVGGVSGRE